MEKVSQLGCVGSGNKLETKEGNLELRKKKARVLAGVTQCIECWPVTKKLQVQFPVRAHAGVAGQVWEQVRGN